MNMKKLFSAIFSRFGRAAVTPPQLKSVLPEVIYAAPGIESNIYFENVVDSATPYAYAFEVKCGRGFCGEKRWYWTPGQEDAGKEFDFELRLFNDYGKVLSCSSKVVVANEPPDYKRKTTLALLADSGVNCKYPDHLLNVMREAGFSNYTPIGSHSGEGAPVVSGGIAHDGYGGFTWGCFLDRWLYSAEDLPQAQSQAEREQMIAFGVCNIPKTRSYLYHSPLLRIEDGKKVLDIPAWLNKINSGAAPDYILIELGANDMFEAMEDSVDDALEKSLKNARKLISALQKHAPDAVIGVVTAPAGCGQDGFAANYKCFQSKYQFRRNIMKYNRALPVLVKEFNDPKIKLIPIHQAIDPDGSYMKRSTPVHARSKTEVLRNSNALHPTFEGGCQLGDAIYCWLRKELEK